MARVGADCGDCGDEGLGWMTGHQRGPAQADEASLEYLPAEFNVLRSGSFVRCAVTGQPIRLEDLKYWSVSLQEPYASPEAVMARLTQNRGTHF
jgi:hypothetical protein